MPKSRRQNTSAPNFWAENAPPGFAEHGHTLYKQSLKAAKSPAAPADGWGVPCWKDADAYPKRHDDLNIWEWRWEFLRRNHGFRTDWLRAEADYHPYNKELYFERAYQLRNVPDPTLSAAAINHAIQHRGPDHNPFESDFFTVVMFEDAFLTKQYALVDEYQRLALETASMKTMVLKIHLDRALTPQFERLEAIARDAQKSWGGKIGPAHFGSREHWSRHLRVLDACDAGASYRQIAEVLKQAGRDFIPGKQDGRDLVKAAEVHRKNWIR